MDNPAPQTGATCGPCPSGLQGDGRICSGELYNCCLVQKQNKFWQLN